MDNVVSKLHKQFYCLPRNMIVKLYKVRCERLRMLMHKGMPTNIQVIIEGKVGVVMQESEDQSALELFVTSVPNGCVAVSVDLLGWHL
ncbi:hypothetical protein J1N35_021896 [Gossypium stocksii]|uniref:Uncharacterized protein n=1 Tax=Gossypium stocksii TaxID=47602 RepID=A0A9D4A2E2_9ROSI|nr:hypothetical protein J1N35_021896 [Gossypium stocksii]